MIPISFYKAGPTAKRTEGRLQSIACMAWFRSDGTIDVQSFKYRIEEEVYTVRDIHVILQEKRNYAACPSIEFFCEVFEGKRKAEFKLIYHMNDCTWWIMIR